MTESIPRRARMDQWTPAERAIYDAMQAVEAMPADARLTKAVTLLGDAMNAVADFVDRVEPAPTAPLTQDNGPLCAACQGCGWCEGSPAFTCPECKGTGRDSSSAVSALPEPSDDADESRRMSNAWWAGRNSVKRLPFALANGPLVRGICRDDIAALLAEQAGAPADESRRMAHAWWAGRNSVKRLPFSLATGPLLRAACRDDIAALLAEQAGAGAAPTAETPDVSR